MTVVIKLSFIPRTINIISMTVADAGIFERGGASPGQRGGAKHISRRPSGLRKTIRAPNSLAHKTTWLRFCVRWRRALLYSEAYEHNGND